MDAIILSIRYLPFTDEYKVMWKERGRLIESKCYYTDNLDDAKQTLKATYNKAQKDRLFVALSNKQLAEELGL